MFICNQHLVDFLPTLHNFLSTTGSKLLQDDRRQVYEAIAYVISAMPMEHAGESLKTFAVDILAQVHAVTSKDTPATKQEIQDISGEILFSRSRRSSYGKMAWKTWK